MKKLLFIVLFSTSMFAFVNTSHAQVRVGVNINIGDQPAWGPTGHDYVEYYYLPEIETYYYVPSRQFVYFSGNHWVHAPYLPQHYARFDLYRGHKVVLNSKHAYKHFNKHKIKYGHYRNDYRQHGKTKYKKDKGNHYGHYKYKKGKDKKHH